MSVSRTGNTTQAQIEMINAAEREFEESAKTLVPPAAQAAGSQGSAAKAAAVVAAVAAAAKGMAPTASAPAAASPLDGLDFHLDEGDRPATPDRSAAKADKDASASPALARSQAASDPDKLDLAFGPDQATFDDSTSSPLDGQWHDAATKLDLAKAYQEMGDVEGAREILQEVLHEGDDTQKSEAQVLLAKLG